MLMATILNPELAIDIENISFHHKGTSEKFFSNLNLKVAKGERFGLFGPNGAGKTTLISLMAGLLRPAAGYIKLLGKEVAGYRNGAAAFTTFGFVPQDLSFYQELTPVQNLEFFGAW